MWVVVTAALVAFAPAPEPKNEPEALFKQMEAKVHKAKTVEVESDMVMEGPMQGSISLRMLYTEGNKGQFTMTLNMEGRTQTMKAVSDGKNMREFEGEKARKTDETPRNLTAALSTMMTRIGMMPMGRSGGEDDPFKAEKFDKDKFVGLSDFKLGKKEKVGEVEAQAVEYKAQLGEKGPKVAVTVWIATKTNLPVKRVLEIKEGDKDVKLTETIKTFKVDEKIDPKTFELKD